MPETSTRPTLRTPDVSEESPAYSLRTKLIFNFDKLMCGQAPCTSATAEEISEPPISDDETLRAYERGMLSGRMQRCDMDWEKRSFQPLMMPYRRVGSRSVRQFALIEALHAAGQQAIVTKGEPCTDELKASVERQVASIPTVSTPARQTQGQGLPAQARPAQQAGLSGGAPAQTTPALQLRAMLVANFGRLACENSYCAPATPAEVANPPLSEENTNLAFELGVLAANAQHCGLDWEGKVVRPSVLQWREATHSERETALFYAILAFSQNGMLASLSGSQCSPEMKKELEQALAKL